MLCSVPGQPAVRTSLISPTAVAPVKEIHAGFSSKEPIWEYTAESLRLECYNRSGTRDSRLALHVRAHPNNNLRVTIQYADNPSELEVGEQLILDNEAISPLNKRIIRVKSFKIRLYLKNPIADENTPIHSSSSSDRILYIGSEFALPTDNWEGYELRLYELNKIKTSSCKITIKTNYADNNVDFKEIKTEQLSDGNSVKRPFDIIVNKTNCADQKHSLNAEFIPEPSLSLDNGDVVLKTLGGEEIGAVLQLQRRDTNIVIPFNQSHHLVNLDGKEMNKTYTIPYDAVIKRHSDKIKFTGGRFSASVVLRVDYI